MDPTYFMQSQDLRTTDDDIADPINERLTLAERNERLQNQLRSLKEDLSHTRDETGQLLPIAGFSCCLRIYRIFHTWAKDDLNVDGLCKKLRDDLFWFS